MKGKEMNDFETWWYHEGSAPPLSDQDLINSIDATFAKTETNRRTT
jgi:hypothetical protein